MAGTKVRNTLVPAVPRSWNKGNDIALNVKSQRERKALSCDVDPLRRKTLPENFGHELRPWKEFQVTQLDSMVADGDDFNNRQVSVVWEDQPQASSMTWMLTRTMDLLSLAETPQLATGAANTMTPVLVLQPSKSLAPIVAESPKHGKLLQKILQFFRLKVEESPVPLVEGNGRENVKSKGKFYDLLHPPKTSHHTHTSSLSSDVSINEEEFQVIKKKLPTKAKPEELVFSRKYHFVGNKVIGKGASGVVRLGVFATDKNHKVALKQFRKRRRSETRQEYLTKLTSEFYIASKMHHPNVVETLDIVHDGNRWYEVMEFCSGGDLFNCIRNDLVDIDEVDYIFSELVHGVHYLHSLGVAHRDLKPENLLIDHEGHLKITDFGVSDLFAQEDCPNEARMSHGICGSSPYIATEEFTAQDYDGRAVDVWAIAIIYYTMVFHTIPWENANLKDANYRQYIEGGPKAFEPFKRLSFGARSLLKQMLQPDPRKRITIPEILDDEWFKAIQECPIKLNGLS